MLSKAAPGKLSRELKSPTVNYALAGNVPVGHVPGLTYSLRAQGSSSFKYLQRIFTIPSSNYKLFEQIMNKDLSNDCLYDINYDSLVSIKDGIFCT